MRLSPPAGRPATSAGCMPCMPVLTAAPSASPAALAGRLPRIHLGQEAVHLPAQRRAPGREGSAGQDWPAERVSGGPRCAEAQQAQLELTCWLARSSRTHLGGELGCPGPSRARCPEHRLCAPPSLFRLHLQPPTPLPLLLTMQRPSRHSATDSSLISRLFPFISILLPNSIRCSPCGGLCVAPQPIRP